MAASTSVCAVIAAPVVAPSSSIQKSSFSGTSVHGLPALRVVRSAGSLRVEASGGKKINTKTPLGPSGGTKFKDGKDAGGSKGKGKGVYQFTKKYGANVDGYSPIYAPDEWATGGSTYAGGSTGLLLWALTLGALLLAGALLVYNTSALA